jgi:exodeoxyribonuclease V alpha subunit
MPLQELVGEYEGAVWRGDNDFIIGRLQDQTTIKGEAKAGTLNAGGSYRFFGKWVNHPKYGRQFTFDHFIEDEPLTRHGVVAYLMRYGKRFGMTFNRSHALYDAFSAECLRKLREDPDECAAQIGMTKPNDLGKLRAMSALLANDRHAVHTKVDLMSLFDGGGFPKTLIDDVIAKWGGRAPTIIKADPFRLLTHRFRGAGFARVDTLYLKLGHPANRMKRQVLAAWNEIGKHGEGDTWIPLGRAYDAVRRSIGAVDASPQKAVKIGLRAKMLASHHHEITWVTTWRRSRNEARIADKICLLNSRYPRALDLQKGTLTDHQFHQAVTATQTNVGILIGTPGTGKTYTIAEVIRQAMQKIDPSHIAVCAPTGKAAVRCTDALKANDLNISAETIHSLLWPQENGHGDGEWRFGYNAQNPLPVSLVVVDEASMVDTDLAASLLAAVPITCRVLFVGDPYQLSPVGHGAPLRDLVAHGVSVGELTEIHRNAGRIVHACRAIKEEQRFAAAEKFAGAEDNLVIAHATNEAESLGILRGFYSQLKEQGKRDLFEDAQIVCPMNAKGALSRTSCASLVQDIINPRQDGDPLVSVYRNNDKIICLSNENYMAAEEKALIYVANGEMGRVEQVTKEGWIICKFPPWGRSEIPRFIKFHDKSDDKDSFALGYAITVHKSQGSQWPIVVVMADGSANRVANKEWWYTAISRASERCLIIGDQRVVERQARMATAIRRKTFLKERLDGTFSTA